MAAGHLVSNHGNNGRPFRLALPLLWLTPVKRAEGPKLYFCGFRPPCLIRSLLEHHTDENFSQGKVVSPSRIFRLVRASSSLHVNSPLATRTAPSNASFSLTKSVIVKHRTLGCPQCLWGNSEKMLGYLWSKNWAWRILVANIWVFLIFSCSYNS